MPNALRIGVDVGGSHITCGIVDTSRPGGKLILHREECNSQEDALPVLKAIAGCIRTAAVNQPVSAVGIAMPGPFDYARGISSITGVGGKFARIFGVNVTQALQDLSGLSSLPFVFTNDAHCFAVGARNRMNLKGRRSVFLTLGTGFGSALMEGDKIVTSHPNVPASGMFFREPFLDSQADDYFSSRWFLKEYQRLTGHTLSSVRELAQKGTPEVSVLFDTFARQLSSFLLPWLKRFACEDLVIGGSIARARIRFEKVLTDAFAELPKPFAITWCDDTEECILTGAALLAEVPVERNTSKRKTTQVVLPVRAVHKQPGYQIFPSFSSGLPISEGFDELAIALAGQRVICIDGFAGVLWEEFRGQLHQSFRAMGKTVLWYDAGTSMKSPPEILDMIQPNLNGDDQVFGKRYAGSLTDFFDTEKLKLLRPDPHADVCIISGVGAAHADWGGSIVYVDIPKNELQYRMRAGAVRNVGGDEQLPNNQAYKRSYFVDWPVLNHHKESLLPELDFIVDGQRPGTITWMTGQNFRDTLDRMLRAPLRARPWFEAGVWGGQWMKRKLAGLNPDEVNYAWSFELITPENGIVMEGAGNLLEVSFDFLLFRDHRKLLGKAASRFGKEFPIRFDFLDTWEGGNLSIQCHPQTSYIQEKFGEAFTQDETYYILDCKPDACVYLGFQEGIQPEKFRAALEGAQAKGIEMEAERFVQKWAAHKHDLFLIPNGTIHASGRNTLVLEISSTPYIFTFKMYDWLRLDLTGQPRPINIGHAFNNLFFDRKGSYVSKKLISRPECIAKWPGGERWKLPTHEEHFYTVERYQFAGTITIATLGQCHCAMLVEGTEIKIKVGATEHTFHFAETFVVPAAVEEYTVTSNGVETAWLVVAFVKEEACLNPGP